MTTIMKTKEKSYATPETKVVCVCSESAFLTGSTAVPGNAVIDDLGEETVYNW